MTPAEKLASEWWDENPTFRGDHTQGMFLSVHDYVYILLWTVGEELSVSRDRAIEVLTPVAEKYLRQQKEKDIEVSE
jgi:hypothetical protein